MNLAKQLKATRSQPTLSSKSEATSIEALIDRLTQSVQQRESGYQPSTTLTEKGYVDVLLDLEVNGVRCVLTRILPSISRSDLLLSPREQEISRMVMKGYSNKLIAKVLEISIWTVSTHLRRIFAKLGVGTRAAMVAHLLELSRSKSTHCES